MVLSLSIEKKSKAVFLAWSSFSLAEMWVRWLTGVEGECWRWWIIVGVSVKGNGSQVANGSLFIVGVERGARPLL